MELPHASHHLNILDYFGGTGPEMTVESLFCQAVEPEWPLDITCSKYVHKINKGQQSIPPCLHDIVTEFKFNQGPFMCWEMETF